MTAAARRKWSARSGLLQVVGLAVAFLVVMTWTTRSHDRPADPMATESLDTLRQGSVYAQSGTERWFNAGAARTLVGDRPIVLAAFRADPLDVPGGASSASQLCQDIAGEFDDLLVVVLTPGPEAEGCVGADWPDIQYVVNEDEDIYRENQERFGYQPYQFGKPGDWGTLTVDNVVASTRMRVAGEPSTPLVAELVAQYDRAVAAQIDGVRPVRTLSDSSDFWWIAGGLVLAAAAAIGLFLGFRWVTRRVAVRRARRKRLEAARAQTLADVQRLAALVDRPMPADSVETVAESYVGAVRLFEDADSEEDFLRVSRLVDRGIAAVNQP